MAGEGGVSVGSWGSGGQCYPLLKRKIAELDG